MIRQTELLKRLEAALETSASASLTPDRMSFARNLAKILVPRIMSIIREEVWAATRARSGQ
jgi:hypothetical protein